MPLLNPSEQISRDIEIKKCALEGIYDEKVMGAMIRSRADKIEFGEKSSKYFFNQEKRNINKKYIDRILTEDGNVITGCNNILNEEVRFYSKLYTSDFKDNVDISEGFSKLDISLEDIPNICQNYSNACEGLLTLQECAVVLKEMKNGKTPGSDGYPIEFFKVFWDQLGHLLVNCFNYCFDRGCMTDEQRRGVITLIPKEGKDNQELNNWRPITLLNVDYKIASKIIANRLKKC
jgi:hypothetical protein